MYTYDKAKCGLQPICLPANTWVLVGFYLSFLFYCKNFDKNYLKPKLYKMNAELKFKHQNLLVQRCQLGAKNVAGPLDGTKFSCCT